MSVKSEGKGSTRKAAQPPAPIDALTGFPGPALEITDGGEIRALNAAGRRLMAVLDRRDANEAALAMLDLIKKACDQGSAARSTLTVPGEAASGMRKLDMTVVPIAARQAYVVGLDITAALDAVAASEQRYRDLVEISADFAWETGADGTFTFVSGNGAFGFATRMLLGKNPRDLLLRDPGAAAVLPLDRRAHV